MLITLEGIDGSGKSTQARLLTERLQAERRRALLVREPGGTELSERVRGLLLDSELRIEPFAELLLFSAARNQLVTERIAPAVAEGIVVVCDRFFDSTTAYQGGGRGLSDLAWLHSFHLRVTGGVVPERTFLIELDAEEAARRRSERRVSSSHDADDRMEGAGIAFQRAVAAAYDVIAREEPDRVMRLDGRRSIEDLHHDIWKEVSALLAARVET